MKRNSIRRKSFRELQFGAMQQINVSELTSEPLPEPYGNRRLHISRRRRKPGVKWARHKAKASALKCAPCVRKQSGTA